VRKCGVLFASGVLAIAFWASPASAISSPRTFSLLEVNGGNNDQPLSGFDFNRPPVGGDRIASANRLYTWAGTKKGAYAGHDQVMISFITGFGSDFSHKATALFTAQVFLHGGTMFAEGYGQLSPNGPSKFTFPILGGTGQYDDVRGYVKVRDLGNGNGNRTNIEFHLLPQAVG
jgi:hypothetical protein